MKIYVLIDDDRKGPYSKADLRKQLLSGGVKRDSLVWHSNIPAWTPLHDLSLTVDEAEEGEEQFSAPLYQMPPIDSVARPRRRKVYRVKQRAPRPFRDWLFRFLKVAR